MPPQYCTECPLGVQTRIDNSLRVVNPYTEKQICYDCYCNLLEGNWPECPECRRRFNVNERYYPDGTGDLFCSERCLARS